MKQYDYLQMIYDAFYDPSTFAYQAFERDAMGMGYYDPISAILLDREFIGELSRNEGIYDGDWRKKFYENAKRAIEKAAGIKLSFPRKNIHQEIRGEWEYDGKRFFVRYENKERGWGRKGYDRLLGVASEDSIKKMDLFMEGIDFVEAETFEAEYPKFRNYKGIIIEKTAKNRAELYSDMWGMTATLYKPRKKGNWILQLTQSHPRLGDRYKTEVKNFTDGLNLYLKFSDLSPLRAETFEARTKRKSITDPFVEYDEITLMPKTDTDELREDMAHSKMVSVPDGKHLGKGRYDRHKRKRKGRKRQNNPKKTDYDNTSLGHDFYKKMQHGKEDMRRLDFNAESYSDEVKAKVFDKIFEWHEQMQLQGEGIEYELDRMRWMLENPDKGYDDYPYTYDGQLREGFDAETTCASCGEGIDEFDIIGDGTNRGLCCVPDYYDDEPEMVHCSFCSKIIGTEEEVYDEESVEWYNANGETICPPCHREREKELKNDLDPHYSPFYAENFEAYSSAKGHYRRKKASKSPASEILTFSAVSGIALGLIYFWKGK